MSKSIIEESGDATADSVSVKRVRSRLSYAEIIMQLDTLNTSQIADYFLQSDWYLNQLQDAHFQITLERFKRRDLVEHYLTVGRSYGLSVSPWFSTEFYSSRYGLGSDLEPLEFHLRRGRELGYRPHPLLESDCSLDDEKDLVSRATELFDEAHYLASNADVASEDVDPLLHYLRWGWKERRSPHPLFDVDFYIAQLESTESPRDLFVHYLTEGWLRGLSPHPMFDVDYYSSQFDGKEFNVSHLEHYLQEGAYRRKSIHRLFDVDFYVRQCGPGRSPADAASDYLTRGAALGLDPHPLFDGRYAVQQGGYRGKSQPLVTYLRSPFSGRAPHPAFNNDFYLRQARLKGRVITDPLSDYLEFGSRERLSPHPLFDPDFYIAQFDRKEPSEGFDLVHYLTKGWMQGVSPHPLFDPESFARTRPRAIAPGCQLTQYLKNPRGTQPHHLFDEEYFRAAAKFEDSGPALSAYVLDKDHHLVATHCLFDPEHYQKELQRKFGLLARDLQGEELSSLKKQLLGKFVKTNPLDHYARIGHKFDISPHASFDTDFYRMETGITVQEDLLKHYLVRGGMATFSPHPAINLTHYKKAIPSFDSKSTPVYQDLTSRPRGRRATTTPLLDIAFYNNRYEDIATWELCPIQHFITHGLKEGRIPNPFYSAAHIDSRHMYDLKVGQSALWEYFARQNKSRTKVLFIGHNASRTGAPLILLKLIQGIVSAYSVDAYTILGEGGELRKDFEESSHTYVMERGLDRQFLDGGVHDREWMREVKSLLQVFGPNGPDLVICNSAETRAFAEYLSEKDIPVVSLIHEAADFYDSVQFSTIFASSKLSIFPSKYTYDRAVQKAPIEPNKVIIRGQGLLDPAYGSLSRAVARQLVSEKIGFPADAPIVVGCGTADFRKGIDIFVDVAIAVLAKMPDVDIRFMWVGDHDPIAGPGSWARRKIEQLGLQDKIRFSGAQKDTEPYLAAADIFVMTSRMDPFPCVIHEAMAVGLPIVAFEKCSGAPEAFQDSGIAVPSEDAGAMAEAVRALILDSDHRKALGRRAKALVSEHWVYSDYVDDVVNAAAEATGVLIKRRLQAPAIKRGETKKTIFFSAPDFGISGVNTFTLNLIRGLVERDFDARLLFTNGRYTYLPSDRHLPNVPHTFLPLAGEHHATKIWERLPSFLAENRPCIYVPNYDYVASATCPIMHPNVGIAGIVHSDDVEHYEHVDRLGRYWDQIVTVSKHIESEVLDMNPAFSSKIRTIYYGVPFNEKEARQGLKKRKLSSDKPIVITYSGRLVVLQKNIMAYAELAERLVELGVPFKMNIIGDGSHYDTLRSRLGGLIGAGLVNLPGRQTHTQIIETLKQSDVFVLLSDFEGLPLSMLEAMALGVIPVVREMKSGIPEVLENGVSGFITPRDSVIAMAKVLQQLQAQPDLRRRLSGNVLDSFVRHRLSQADMVEDYERLFNQMFVDLADRKKPRAKPLAHNAPIYGIAAPPFLTQK